MCWCYVLTHTFWSCLYALLTLAKWIGVLFDAAAKYDPEFAGRNMGMGRSLDSSQLPSRSFQTNHVGWKANGAVLCHD